MKFSNAVGLLAGVTAAVASPTLEQRGPQDDVTVVQEIKYVYADCDTIKPKVVIISLFSPEADIWYANDENEGSIGDLFAKNITVPGLSPLFPDVHCLADNSVCQLTTGESEINAATTISSFLASPKFDLTNTYFLIGGIAGISPKAGTLGSVSFAKYAVQVALQYEFDAREIPENWTTGYFAQGAYEPGEYPTSIYGSEVFELNEALRDIAVNFTTGITLNDSDAAIAYRANYLNGSDLYAMGAAAPSVITVDVATSDVYFSGTLLGEAFENTTTLWTNGSGVYGLTAQEDNAILEAMTRFAAVEAVDFSRIILMRTASDFDRPYPGEDAVYNLLYADQGGFTIAVENIYIAGVKVVQGILGEWDSKFAAGITPTNYIGDIFGTLGGTPDFGPGPETEPELRRRSMGGMGLRKKGMDGAKAARYANGNY